MTVMRNHGGGCCGMRHILNFYGKSPQTIESLKIAFRQVPSRRLAEVVLQLSQAKNWGDILAGLGFVPVGKFTNGNTGNTLYIFWYYSGKMEVTPLDVSSLPFSFNAEKGRKELDSAPSNDSTIRHGDLVTVNSPRSKWNGRVGTVMYFTQKYYGGRYAVVRIGDPFTGYDTVAIVVHNLKKVMK